MLRPYCPNSSTTWLPCSSCSMMPPALAPPCPLSARNPNRSQASRRRCSVCKADKLTPISDAKSPTSAAFNPMNCRSQFSRKCRETFQALEAATSDKFSDSRRTSMSWGSTSSYPIRTTPSGVTPATTAAGLVQRERDDPGGKQLLEALHLAAPVVVLALPAVLAFHVEYQRYRRGLLDQAGQQHPRQEGLAGSRSAKHPDRPVGEGRQIQAGPTTIPSPVATPARSRPSRARKTASMSAWDAAYTGAKCSGMVLACSALRSALP